MRRGAETRLWPRLKRLPRRLTGKAGATFAPSSTHTYLVPSGAGDNRPFPGIGCHRPAGAFRARAEANTGHLAQAPRRTRVWSRSSPRQGARADGEEAATGGDRASGGGAVSRDISCWGCLDETIENRYFSAHCRYYV
eukprot:gene24726-32204_t